MTIKYLCIYSTLGCNINQISINEALHAPELNHFNTKLLEAEHVLHVFKIEHDIKDLLPLKSEYIEMMRSIYSF
jgi:hypothetical protein